MKRLILILTSIVIGYAATFTASDNNLLENQESDTINYFDDDDTAICQVETVNTQYGPSASVSGTRAGMNVYLVGTGVVIAAATASIIVMTNGSGSSSPSSNDSFFGHTH